MVYARCWGDNCFLAGKATPELPRERIYRVQQSQYRWRCICSHDSCWVHTGELASNEQLEVEASMSGHTLCVVRLCSTIHGKCTYNWKWIFTRFVFVANSFEPNVKSALKWMGRVTLVKHLLYNVLATRKCSNQNLALWGLGLMFFCCCFLR